MIKYQFHQIPPIFGLNLSICIVARYDRIFQLHFWRVSVKNSPFMTKLSLAREMHPIRCPKLDFKLEIKEFNDIIFGSRCAERHTHTLNIFHVILHFMWYRFELKPGSAIDDMTHCIRTEIMKILYQISVGRCCLKSCFNQTHTTHNIFTVCVCLFSIMTCFSRSDARYIVRLIIMLFDMCVFMYTRYGCGWWWTHWFDYNRLNLLFSIYFTFSYSMCHVMMMHAHSKWSERIWNIFENKNLS